MERPRLSSIVVALLLGGVTLSGAEAAPGAADEPAPLPPPRTDGDEPPAPDSDEARAEANEKADAGEEAEKDERAEAEADADSADDGDDDDGADEDGEDEDEDEDEKMAPAASEAPWTIRRVLEKTTGLPVSGNVTVRLKSRWTNADDSDSDHDLYTYLNLHVGSEAKDPVSATFSTRVTWDLDGYDDDDSDEYAFASLADTYDSPLNGRVYMGYVSWKPEGGPVEILRTGRQYVDVAETFHVDGVHAQSRVLAKKIGLRASVYGGVPVHLYESEQKGDWMAGFQVTAEPAKGTRVALDYTHVEDDLDFLGEQHDNLAALSAWQGLDLGAIPLELHGRVTYLERLRDATLRATARFPDQDLLVQASYFRLFAQKNQYATEFDPYFSVLHSLREYQNGRLRVVKGFGEDIVVEAGADIRRMADGEDEGTFNHDATRVYVVPSIENVPWEGSSLSFIGEHWSGNRTDMDTYGGEFGYRWGQQKLTVGSDYSLYALGPLGNDEREHVRRYYVRAEYDVSDDVTVDVRFTREDDDEETFNLLSISVSYDF